MCYECDIGHASSYGIWAGCLGLGRSARWGLALFLFGGNLQRYWSLQQYRSAGDWTNGSVRFVCLIITYGIEPIAYTQGASYISFHIVECKMVYEMWILCTPILLMHVCVLHYGVLHVLYIPLCCVACFVFSNMFFSIFTFSSMLYCRCYVLQYVVLQVLCSPVCCVACVTFSSMLYCRFYVLHYVVLRGLMFFRMLYCMFIFSSMLCCMFDILR